MGLRKDRKGMAVLVDALIFLVVLTLLIAVIHSSSEDGVSDERTELLRSYHSVMLAGELPGKDGSSLSTATLSDYLIALAISGAPGEEQIETIEGMVNGTLAELERTDGKSWLIIELGPVSLHFGSVATEENGDVHADRRELGDGSVVSTIYLSD